MNHRLPTVVVPLPSREGIESKGRRLLLEHRLRVLSVHAGRIRAECRGSDAVYRLGFSEGHWWCHCPARGRCAHLVALQAVTTVPTDGAA
jgi:hypothetical protein